MQMTQHACALIDILTNTLQLSRVVEIRTTDRFPVREDEVVVRK